MKKILFVISAIILLTVPVRSFSQEASLASSRSLVSGWLPIKITAEGNNIVNGVEFYKKSENCNGQELLIVKLINNNNYGVTVNWKDIKGIEQSISLNPSSQIEGTCLSFVNKTGTNNEHKLTALKPNKEEKKVFLSTLTVIKSN